VYAELHEYTRSARKDIRGGIYIYIHICIHIYMVGTFILGTRL